jgi:hypothetical protein
VAVESWVVGQVEWEATGWGEAAVGWEKAAVGREKAGWVAGWEMEAVGRGATSWATAAGSTAAVEESAGEG